MPTKHSWTFWLHCINVACKFTCFVLKNTIKSVVLKVETQHLGQVITAFRRLFDGKAADDARYRHYCNSGAFGCHRRKTVIYLCHHRVL